jgi:hypothetical protein
MSQRKESDRRCRFAGISGQAIRCRQPGRSPAVE